MRRTQWPAAVWVLILCTGCSHFEPVARTPVGGNAHRGDRPGTREGTSRSEPQGYSSQPTLSRRTWTGLTNEQIVALANEIKIFLGAPYLWGGSSPEGVDCSGFVYAVFRRAWGLILPRSAEGLYGVGDPVDLDSLRFSDLVFFNAPGVRQVTHVGIYVAKGRFVHASPTDGVTLAHLDDEYFRQHYAGARRLVRYVAK